MDNKDKNYIKWAAISSMVLTVIMILFLLSLGVCIAVLTLKFLGYAI